MKRYVYNDMDGYYQQIAPQIANNKIQLEVVGDELFDPLSDKYLPKLNDSAILIYGYNSYLKVRDLHKAGEIHIGLRKFNYIDILALPYVHIGTNKVIFARNPVDGEFGDYGEIHMDQYLYRLTSKDIEVDPPPIPTPELLGMQDVIDQDIFNRISKCINKGLVKHFSLDFESDGLPMQIGFQPIGVSISITKGSDPENKLGPGSYDNQFDYSCYIDFMKIHKGILNDDTDKPEYPDVKYNFWIAFKEFMDKHYNICWVYNCKFEINAFYVIFSKHWNEKYNKAVPPSMDKVEPPFYEMQDCYTLAICDDNKKSLKFSAQKYLGVPSWDDQLDDQMNQIQHLFDTFNTFEDMYNKYLESKLIYNNLTPDEQDHIGDLIDPRKWIYKNNPDGYSHSFDYWMSLDEEYREIILNRQKGKNWKYNPWVSSDPDMKGLYCCYDSARTDQIVSKLYPIYKMPYENVYIKNWWLGAALEGSGMHCDTNKRSILSKFVYNVYNNSKLWMNRLYFTMYVRYWKSIFEKYDNHPARELLKKCPALVQPDPIWWSKALLDFLIIDDGNYNKLDFSKLPIDESDRTSLELDLQWFVNELSNSNLSSVKRKRGWMNEIYKVAMPYLGIDNLIREINRVNLELVKDEWEKYNQWFIDGFWTQDPSIEFLHRARTELGWKNKSEDMQFLNDLPKELIENLNHIFDVMDLDTYLLNGIEDYIPKFILDKYKDKFIHPSDLSTYWQYIDKLDQYKLLDNMKYDSDTPSELMPDVDIFGYNSSMGDDNIRYWKFLMKFYCLEMVSISEYIIFTTNMDNDAIANGYDIHRSKSTDLGLHNNLEMLKKFATSVQSNISASQCYKAACEGDTTFFNGLDRMNCMNGVQWGHPELINHSNLDLTLNEDPYLLIMKLCIMKSYYHATQKVTSTYIKALFGQAAQNEAVGPEKFQRNWVDGYQDPSDKTDILFWDFQTNQKATKRWSSGFHTMKPHSDVMKCITAPKGWINTYFDISQAEPRSAAYTNHDKVWQKLYDDGVDSYMYLARIAEPTAAEEKLRESRSDYKRSVISILYGIGDGSLASQLGKSLQDTQKIRATFFGQFREVHKCVMKKQLYCKMFGYIDSMLGDKIAGEITRWDKTGINYYMQNGAACILAAGFYDLYHYAKQYGIPCYPKSIIHDSVTNIVRIKDIFKISLLYKKYFRRAYKKRFEIDFKYDLDLSINMLNHIGFSFDPDTLECSIHAHEEDTNTIMDELAKVYEIEMIEDKHYDAPYDHGVGPFVKNACDFFIHRINDREHIMCTDPAFDDMKIRDVKFKIDHLEQDVLDWYNDDSDLVDKSYFVELKEYQKSEPRAYRTDQLDNYTFNDDGTIFDDKGNEVILFNRRH